MPRDFTLEPIYLTETQLKDTLPDEAELDTAVLAALNCQQVLRHMHTQNKQSTARPGNFFVFTEKEDCFSQIPQEQKQKWRG